MLSSIGRAAVRRVVATAPQSTNRARQNIWRLQRVDALQKADNVSTHSNLAFSFRRSYVTATKAAPKKSAAKKPAARKSAAKPKAKKAAPKKAAKKKAVKKAKPKKVLKKKVLTEEEKAKVELRKLKIAALSPPKDRPSSAWAVLLEETFASTEVKGGKDGLGHVAAASAAKYKSLAPAELEAYNHIANQNRAANKIALKQWVESHTPDQIRVANNARKQLKRKLTARKYPLIPDDRAPKHPTNAMIYYMKEKHASGDLKGLKLSETAGLLSQEWKNLSASERKPFEDLALLSKQRYAQELKTVFNRDVKTG